MFRKYQVMEACAEADKLISVALIKNHAFMGVTGCLKNLGLMPGPLRRTPPYLLPPSGAHALPPGRSGPPLRPALCIVEAW